MAEFVRPSAYRSTYRTTLAGNELIQKKIGDKKSAGSNSPVRR